MILPHKENKNNSLSTNFILKKLKRDIDGSTKKLKPDLSNISGDINIAQNSVMSGLAESLLSKVSDKV